MSWWSNINNLFSGNNANQNSAKCAEDRLKVIIASQRRLNSRLTDDKIEEMKRKIMSVVNEYVGGVKLDDINIQHRHDDNYDMLEMNINLPDRR